MDENPRKSSCSALQNVLLKLHGKLVEITKNYEITDIKLESDDYLERLLCFLESELKKYGMYSKFENMSEGFRKKELFILLTKHLGVKLFQDEAGDVDPCKSSTQFDSNENENSADNDFEQDFSNDSLPTMQNLFSKCQPLRENKYQNNFHIQFQLYNDILHSIQQELNGISLMKKDPITNVFLVGLCIREISTLTKLPVKERRRQMLTLLASRLTEKCNQISLLDMIKDARKESKTFYKQSHNQPIKSWEKMINIGPKQTLKHLLYNTYPLFLTEMFLEYLSREKENIILDEENIFRTKITILKKEGLETVDSMKKNLGYKKYIDGFLNEYVQQFQKHYEKTESEFYRQEQLKNRIEEVLMEIKII